MTESAVFVFTVSSG